MTEAEIKEQDWLQETCYDCNGDVQVLRKDCPKCKQGSTLGKIYKERYDEN